MKQGWEVRKLGDVCELINRGVSPKYTETDGLIVLNQKCIRNHEVNYELARTHDSKVKPVSHEKLIQIGDVLINSTGTGTLGRVAQIRDEPNHATVDSHITIVRPLANVFYNDFFGYALILIEEEIAKRGEGCGGQTELARSTLKNEFNISYPKSLPEQQRIVAILDEAFAAITQAKANAEQNLKNDKELFESYLQSVFENKGEGWEVKKLGDICELKSGTTISPSLERIEGDVLYVKVGDMNLPNNEVEITTSSRFVNSNEIKINQIIPEGAIIFPKRGGAIATNKKRKIIKPTIVDLNTMAIIPSKRVDKDYFFHWFQLFDLNSISNGANIPQINNYSFDEVYFPYPISLKEQQTIVQKLDALSTETKQLVAIYQQKINDLDELKKSILQKAFAGELNTTTLEV